MSKERIGSIKDHTPNFKIIIPRFDLATWHDYIEENFRNIDALFFNLFGINNYSGSWKQITEYKQGQVLFIGDDRDINGNVTEFSGRLVKVLVDHVTDNSDYFNVFYNLHPEYYELFADASTAQIYAQQAQSYKNDTETLKNEADLIKSDVITKQNEINDTISSFNEDFSVKSEQITQQIEDSKVIIAQETAISIENVEKSRVWAEGEQAEVEPLGGSLSSMGAADLAYAIANAPEDTPIDTSGLFAMNVVKGPKGDKGDKGEDGKEFDALNFLNLIYPVGSIYISTTSTCPIQDFGIGTWELVAADRVLQGAGTRGAVGTQLAESLPQHTHTRGSMEISGTLGASGNKVAIGNAQSTALGVSGVFTQSNRTDWLGYAGGGGGYSQGCTITFTASRNWTGSTSNASGSTYQSNAKVQQDAYLVNIFRRVA